MLLKRLEIHNVINQITLENITSSFGVYQGETFPVEWKK